MERSRRIGRKEDAEEEDKEIGNQEEDEMNEKEVERAIKKLKIKKEIDGIPMETWKYANAELKKRLLDLLRIIWRKGKILEDWRKCIMLLYKKGKREKIRNYRGISVLCLAYKIYADVLRNRLEKEIEVKELISENQTGFRKGSSMIDNIFILNHLMQKENKQRGKEKCICCLRT